VVGFERIGPYAYRRGDLIAAALAISFAIGARSVRIRMGIMAAIGIAVVVTGIAIGDYGISAIAAIALLSMFIIGPALRSQKNNKNICLSAAEDGLVAETNDVRTTYKWSTIRSYRRIGSRLFIMVNDQCAIVVPDRVTDGENIGKLIELLAGRQPAAPSPR
jgi:hypothetical protein